MLMVHYLSVWRDSYHVCEFTGDLIFQSESRHSEELTLLWFTGKVVVPYLAETLRHRIT